MQPPWSRSETQGWAAFRNSTAEFHATMPPGGERLPGYTVQYTQDPIGPGKPQGICSMNSFEQ